MIIKSLLSYLRVGSHKKVGVFLKIIIIGGVAAGMSAASKIKRTMSDAHVLVVEKGGETSYGACGLPYYVSNVNEDEDLLRIRKPEAFIKSGIDLRLFHEAIKVDEKNKIVTIKDLASGESKEESYDKLVIATGARAIVPPLSGIDLKGIYSLKSIPDANKMKEALTEDVKKVAVVGGGYIGLEMVEALVHMNKKVVLFEMADRLLTNFDPEFSDEIKEYLESLGVEIHLGEGITSFIGSKKVEEIVTTKGQYSVDMVVLSIGVRPNTEFLKDTGISMLQNGAIVVNKYMETTVADIYAGGDCATVYHHVLKKDVFIPLGTNANKQGKYIGETICGTPHKYDTAIGTAMIKICDYELARTGISEKEAIDNGFNYSTVLVKGANHAPYYPNPKDVTIKLIYEKESYKLLGAQLMGEEGAALRVNVFAVCITQGMSVKEIAELDLGYAPPFAMPWDIIHIACNAAK